MKSLDLSTIERRTISGLSKLASYGTPAGYRGKRATGMIFDEWSSMLTPNEERFLRAMKIVNLSSTERFTRPQFDRVGFMRCVERKAKSGHSKHERWKSLWTEYLTQRLIG